MAAKRIRRDLEPIAELFGDVVQDSPSLLYGSDEPEAAASPAPRPDPASEPEAAPSPPAEPPKAAAPAVGPAARPRSDRVRFVEDKGLLTGVVVLYGLITVLTLGLGRFWQKTEQRRIVWSHTELDGEPLEYLGRAAEMLLGALIAVVFLGAMLAVAQISLMFLGLAAMPDLGAAPAELAPMAVAAGLGLPPLIQYALFRARRYRLSRTRWRGLRFGMQGSGLSVVGLWLMWLPAVALSAGLLLPFWRWARERHLSGRTLWGRERLRFEGSPLPLFLHWLPLWGLVAAAIAALAFAPSREALAGAAARAGGALGVGAEGATVAGAAIGGLVFALTLAALALNYRAAETRLFWRARRLLGARADCRFSAWNLLDALMATAGRNLWPGAAVWLLSVAVMALAVMGAVGIEATGGGGLGAPGLDDLGEALFGGAGSWRAQALLMLGVGVTYAISAVFSMYLWTAVYARRVHRHLCDSLTVHGLETLEEGRGRARGDQRDAEGFADALDLGGAF